MTILSSICLVALLSAHPVLVETSELGALDNAIAVDARSAEEFEAGHVAGAAHADVESLAEDRDGISGLLKPMESVRAALAGAGLDPGKTLVVYTANDAAGDVKRATRLFWVLEYAGYPDVRLLNGGLSKWNAEGLPVERGASGVAPVDPAAVSALTPDESRFASREEVQAARVAPKGLIVDLRDPEYFTGEKKSGAAPRAGHIPGAKNRPGDAFLEGPYFMFKAPGLIKASLAADDGQSVVTYCNTGRVASVGYAAYRIAGFEDVSLYDGSMSEWGSHEDCPVDTGGAE